MGLLAVAAGTELPLLAALAGVVLAGVVLPRWQLVLVGMAAAEAVALVALVALAV